LDPIQIRIYNTAKEFQQGLFATSEVNTGIYYLQYEVEILEVIKGGRRVSVCLCDSMLLLRAGLMERLYSPPPPPPPRLPPPRESTERELTTQKTTEIDTLE
jgi:hypothetical protein